MAILDEGHITRYVCMHIPIMVAYSIPSKNGRMNLLLINLSSLVLYWMYTIVLVPHILMSTRPHIDSKFMHVMYILMGLFKLTCANTQSESYSHWF